MDSCYAPSRARAPLASESAASATWVSSISALTVAAGGALSLLQPSLPAAVVLAVSAGAPDFSGSVRERDAFDEASAVKYMDAVGQPLLEALAAVLLSSADAAAGANALAPGGAIAARAEAAARALCGDAAYVAARGPLVERTVPLSHAAALVTDEESASAAAAGEHGGEGVEGQTDISPEELETILAPFKVQVANKRRLAEEQLRKDRAY
jgi:hypothetical protein